MKIVEEWWYTSPSSVVYILLGFWWGQNLLPDAVGSGKIQGTRQVVERKALRNRASMQRRPLPYRFLAALLLLVIFPRAMPAQSTSASLTGRITDSRRTVISEATVEVINTSTGIHYHGLTNEAGIYYVSDLPPGRYRIEVEKLGFIAVIESGIILHVQDALEVNFEMELGSVSESVTVEGLSLIHI